MSFAIASDAKAVVPPPPETGPQEVPLTLDRIFATGNANIDIDGLDDKRVDVDIAVLDSGVKLDHRDLNVFRRTNCTGATQANGYACTSASPNDGNDDEAGLWHGTASALNAAAIDNGIGRVGVAAGARIWAVDIHKTHVTPENPIQNLETAIAGVKWVTAHAGEIEVAHFLLTCKPGTPTPLLPECGPDPKNAARVAELVAELETAVDKSIEKGVVYVAPSGNSNLDIGEAVPQQFDDVFVVSGMADSDGKPGGGAGKPCGASEDESWGSGWGTVVDVTSPGCATSGSSTYVTAAAAILASKGNPENAADVAAIGEEIFGGSDCAKPSPGSPDVGAANCGWTDKSPDGIKEPLLDVGSEAIFAPTTTPGCGAVGGDVESDVNGDGRSDLVTLRPDGHVHVYGGNSEYKFDPAVVSFDDESEDDPLPSALYIGAGHHVIDVADVTGDGCDDLVTLDSEGNAHVYPGKPDRTFDFDTASLEGTMAPALLKSGGSEPIAAADVNGDGRADLVSFNDLPYGDVGGRLMVNLGNANGSFTKTAKVAETKVFSALHSGSGEYFADVADVTGDGKADLVSMTTWQDPWVRPGSGSEGDFANPISTEVQSKFKVDPAMDNGSGEEPLGLGDVNGDGKADLVTATGGNSYLYPGTSGGWFTARIKMSTGTSTTFNPANLFEVAGILNVDGDPFADTVLRDASGITVGKGSASGLVAGAVQSLAGFKSTQHFQNLTSGNEMVIAKPAYRRRGCAANGCHNSTASSSLVSGIGTAYRSDVISHFFTDASGNVIQRWWHESLGWSGPGNHASPPGGPVTSEPAAAAILSPASSVHVFVRGADGALWQKTYADSTTSWSAWSSLGGTLAAGTAPTAVSPAPGTLHVFVRAATSNLLVRRIWTTASGWGAWEQVPPEATTTALGVGFNGVVNLFMRDASDNLIQRWCCPEPGKWSAPGNHGSPPGGASSSAPVFIGASGIDHVLVRGADRALWEKTWNGSSWSAWTSLGGVLRSAPSAVATAAGEIHVFARGANDSTWRKRWSVGAGWSAWEPAY